MGNQQLGIVRQRRIEKKYEIKTLGTEIWVNINTLYIKNINVQLLINYY